MGLEFRGGVRVEESSGLREATGKQRRYQDCGWLEVWKAVTRVAGVMMGL